MLLDAGRFVMAPSRGGGRNPICEKAIDDAGQQIPQVLGIAGDGDDIVSMIWIGDEGVDAVIGIHEPGNDPETKLLLHERIEHLLNCIERVSAVAASG